MPHGTHNAEKDPRNQSILISINGELYPRNEAKISVFDSGYLVGDGVWEALRVYNNILVFAEDHFARLWTGAATIGMKLSFTKEELKQRIFQVLKANSMQDGVHVRIMVTRGFKSTPSQDPRLTISPPNVVIIPEYKIASVESNSKGISLFTSTIRRGSPDYLDPKLNCHSKIFEVQALIQAIEAGADEALMLDVHGNVSTCNATNFFIVKNNTVITSTGVYCMNGVTRQKIIEICIENNIPCLQKNFSLFNVYGADEAFVTGSFGGITPVRKIDGRVIGNGHTPMIETLQNAYTHLIEKYIENHANV